MIEQLPEPIIEHIREVVEREYEYRDNALHCTELLYCTLKAWLRRRSPITKDVDALWYAYRGLVFDQLWTSLFPRNQVRVTYRIAGGPTIVGKIDFIDTSGGEPVIYELKTVTTLRAVKDGPKPEHEKQVMFYAFCEAIERAKIVYVSFEGIRIFDIDCSEDLVMPVVRELEDKAMELYEALKRNEPPLPDAKEWECRYCEFFGELCGGREVGYIGELWQDRDEIENFK